VPFWEEGLCPSLDLESLVDFTARLDEPALPNFTEQPCGLITGYPL
jgi:hypothetical protein